MVRMIIVKTSNMSSPYSTLFMVIDAIIVTAIIGLIMGAYEFLGTNKQDKFSNLSKAIATASIAPVPESSTRYHVILPSDFKWEFVKFSIANPPKPLVNSVKPLLKRLRTSDAPYIDGEVVIDGKRFFVGLYRMKALYESFYSNKMTDDFVRNSDIAYVQIPINNQITNRFFNAKVLFFPISIIALSVVICIKQLRFRVMERPAQIINEKVLGLINGDNGKMSNLRNTNLFFLNEVASNLVLLEKTIHEKELIYEEKQQKLVSRQQDADKIMELNIRISEQLSRENVPFLETLKGVLHEIGSTYMCDCSFSCMDNNSGKGTSVRYWVSNGAFQEVPFLINEYSTFLNVVGKQPALVIPLCNDEYLKKFNISIDPKVLEFILSKSVIAVPLYSGSRTFVLAMAREEEPFSKLEVGSVIDIGSKIKHLLARIELSDEIAKLSQSIITVQEEERAALARELHDDIGQSLTALKICISNPDLYSINSELHKTFEEALDKAIQKAKNISNVLQPLMLKDLGLIPALMSYLQEFEVLTSITVDFKHSGVEESILSEEKKVGIYRIIQEGLNNIAKHAQTNKANLSLWYSNGRITIDLIDHGKGFNTDHLMKDSLTHGIRGMRERVKMLNGQFSISSQPGAGTKIIITVPIGEYEQDDINSDCRGPSAS